MKHVASIGGGLASTMELPERLIRWYGRDDVHLIMARLPNEDPDVWRLCSAVERWLGVSITYIGLNMTPWDIFFKERMMGSSRLDPCSKKLKREVIDRYLKDNFDPTDTVRYIGFGPDEAHRMVKMLSIMDRKGWRVEAPLLNDETVTHEYLMEKCQRLFGFVPRLYKWGFTHNNCGGACVKAGHKEWARLLWFLPDVYEWWETNEQRFQREIGTEATILRDRRGGTTTPLSLRAFRERMQEQWRALPCGVDPFVGLDDTPACVFCGAA